MMNYLTGKEIVQILITLPNVICSQFCPIRIATVVTKQHNHCKVMTPTLSTLLLTASNTHHHTLCSTAV